MDEAPIPGLFGCFLQKEEQMEYAILVTSEQGKRKISFPPLTWLIFDCVGPVPGAIQGCWRYLQEEWKNPFRHASYPELEWYSAGNSYDPNYLSQIWIPIIEEEEHGSFSLL